MEEQEIYDYLLEMGIASEEELDIITGINGFSEETLNSVIYYKTAYQDIEQYLECEDKEKYEEFYGDNEEDEDEEDI